MITIMITIRKRHLNNMRKGVKPYELRLTRPKVSPPFRVLCCVSGTGGAVEAAFTCPACPELTCPDGKIAELGHITVEEVRSYRREGTLYGWKVEDFEDWKAEGRAKHITDYGITRPPQSWCYVRRDTNDTETSSRRPDPRG